MSGQPFALVREFKVGARFTVRFSVPAGEIGEEVAPVVEWMPVRPDLFTRDELDDLERGHALLLRELSAVLGWNVAAVSAPPRMLH